MKVLTVDVDRLEDFIFILDEAKTVLFADTSGAYDRLFIIPMTHFPAQYCHLAEKGTWRDRIMDHYKVIEATLNDE
jgi:hypothetical protein